MSDKLIVKRVNHEAFEITFMDASLRTSRDYSPISHGVFNDVDFISAISPEFVVDGQVSDASYEFYLLGACPQYDSKLFVVPEHCQKDFAKAIEEFGGKVIDDFATPSGGFVMGVDKAMVGSDTSAITCPVCHTSYREDTKVYTDIQQQMYRDIADNDRIKKLEAEGELLRGMVETLNWRLKEVNEHHKALEAENDDLKLRLVEAKRVCKEVIAKTKETLSGLKFHDPICGEFYKVPHTPPDKLFCSAVLQDGHIWTNLRHGHIIPVVFKATGKRVMREEQGFYTENGHFLNREDAIPVAKKHGQIPQDYNKILCSEDLW